MLTEDVARTALAEVRYPGLNRDIMALGLVHSLAVYREQVRVTLMLSTDREDVPDLLRSEIRERLEEAGAVQTEVLVLTPEARRTKNPSANRGRLPNVGAVVAVGAGKGGVGKSTVAVNLALALVGSGYRVGVLDADIYGPSVPMLLGLEDGGTRVRMTDQKQIVPLESFGVSVVSFGFFLGAGSPAVWRGPLVGKAVKQFSRGVLWPTLDVLVIDLPPGTGDVPLSLAQSIVIDGAVVVTTPQRLAATETEKAVEMFRKLEVPVLGVVENMAFAECECGRRSHPFGAGGGAKLAEAAGIALLGLVPFEEGTVQGGDMGEPVVRRSPGTTTAEAFQSIAREVARGLRLPTGDGNDAGVAP